MLIKHSRDVEKKPMPMAGAQGVQMQLLCGPEDGCPTFAMRLFSVEPGGHTPRHAHDYEHEVFILAGEGVAFSQAGERRIRTGDAIFVSANEQHQFRNTSNVPLQFICMVPSSVHRPIDCACDIKK